MVQLSSFQKIQLLGIYIFGSAFVEVVSRNGVGGLVMDGCGWL